MVKEGVIWDLTSSYRSEGKEESGEGESEYGYRPRPLGFLVLRGIGDGCWVGVGHTAGLEGG